MAAIHGEDQVETLEIRPLDLACAQFPEVVAATQGMALGAVVRRFADVVVVGAGGIHFDQSLEARVARQAAQHAICGRRAADVAGADDQHRRFCAQNHAVRNKKMSFRPARGLEAVYMGQYGRLIAMTDSRNTKKPRAGRRTLVDVRGREWFAVGKYRVLSEPLPGAMQMRRYSIFSDGRRIGATVSMPTESDCLHLERPRPVPPLKPFFVAYRPGRPKKGATPPAAAATFSERAHTVSREDLPPGAPIREFAASEEDG